jgi:hypothetical protein
MGDKGDLSDDRNPTKTAKGYKIQFGAIPQSGRVVSILALRRYQRGSNIRPKPLAARYALSHFQ